MPNTKARKSNQTQRRNSHVDLRSIPSKTNTHEKSPTTQIQVKTIGTRASRGPDVGILVHVPTGKSAVLPVRTHHHPPPAAH